jgi:GNAT superfamily N-acetyltransferase
MTAPALAGDAVLRAAEPGDVDGILALIHALAIYEREPDAVENTTEMLTETLFGPEPRAFAHVVVRGERVVGIAIWFLTYSTWTGRHGIWLEDLYVDEAERGSGYGKALMRALAGVCLERGYSRFEWTVLDWNPPRWRRNRGSVAVSPVSATRRGFGGSPRACRPARVA